MSLHGGGTTGRSGGGEHSGYHHSSHRSYAGSRGGFSEVNGSKEPPKIYYTSERTFYAPPVAADDGTGTTVIVENDKPVWNCWLICLLIIFIILLVIVIIALIILFVSGIGGGSTIRSSEYVGSGSNSVQRYTDFRTPSGHYDLVHSGKLLSDLSANSGQFCPLEVGTKDSYEKEHIPSARYFSPSSILVLGAGGRRILAHPRDFTEYARSLGVKEDCNIVIYNQNNQFSPFTMATWVWWIFKTYGYARVSVLQGGLREWKQLKQPTTSDTLPEVRGSLRGGWDPNTSIDQEELRRLIAQPVETFQLLDTRSDEYFSGAKKSENSKSTGNIRNSVNFPASTVHDGYKVKNFDDIKQELANRNLNANTLTVVYGDNEMDPSAVFFVLYQLGYNVRLYSGGWVEWSNNA